MDLKNIYLLLKVIAENKSVSLLLNQGLTYKAIGELTEEAAVKNLIEISGDSIKLTELGQNNFLEYAKIYKKRNKETWIEKEDKSRIPKLDEDFIYLPDQNDLPL
jgi:hypothetical protein